MTRLSVPSIAVLLCLVPLSAAADTFDAGSLVIPMDTDYQDDGMFEAFGLVYRLLQNNVRVQWVIKEGKGYGDADFTTSSVDLQTGAPITDHGYRGGPWVIAAADAEAAKTIIAQWHATYPTVAVHEVTEAFDGDVAHTLIVAPTIAMLADGNQDIARKYMEAAKIPDSEGNLEWPDDSPDMLTVAEVMGASDVDHRDGALFDGEGNPRYCQFMSMHWGVGDAEDNPEVVAEVREFLAHPTHFFAECQAVNAFENTAPHGFFLTESGFLIGERPDTYSFHQMDTPFGQLDGAFESVGGSEPSYSLPLGDEYKAQDIVLITDAETPIGVNDVWMTGFLDGVCPQAEKDPNAFTTDAGEPSHAAGTCLTNGKVSYLGGHEYSTDLPISANPQSQGTRMFLNSLFEAPCATEEGFPSIQLEKSAPAFTSEPELTFTIEYANWGNLPVFDVVVTDHVADGWQLVTASDGAAIDGGTITWSLDTLAAKEQGTVSFTVELPAYGTYENTATIDYRVAVNTFSLDSNQTVTEYGDSVDDSGGSDETGGASASDGSATSGSASNSDGDGSEDAGGTSDDASGGTLDGGTDGGGSVGFGEDPPDGCGCRTSHGGRHWWLLIGVLGLGLGRRRRT